MFGFTRKSVFKKGFKKGKKEYQAELRKKEKQIKILEAKLESTERRHKNEKEKLFRYYKKKVAGIYKRMDYRIAKAVDIITSAESMLNEIKSLELWVNTNFQKALQAQAGFINGLTSKVDDLLIEKGKIKKQLNDISQEKKVFNQRNDVQGVTINVEREE